MIDRKTYLNLKREIKDTPRVFVVKLCEDMMLNTEEKTLLMNMYDNKSVIQTCMELSFSEFTYNYKMKKLFTKINNYKNTLN